MTRTTKDTPALDCYDGLRRNRNAVLDMVDSSLLVRHGLVDPDALRAVAAAPAVGGAGVLAVLRLPASDDPDHDLRSTGMIPRLHPKVVTTATDTGMVLLDQEAGRYFELNAGRQPSRP
ncbi:hypothetical protein AB0I60_27340 [Actinosynnema sp. NPDC050436]|uniref:hypothetical protein n=1 Tax=Actinosynnema sp. NPDC050436 TaxID=3155659 RepID=UPI0033C63DD9